MRRSTRLVLALCAVVGSWPQVPSASAQSKKGSAEYARARSFEQAGDLEQAIESFDRVIREAEEPVRAYVIAKRAVMAARLGRCTEADQPLHEAAKGGGSQATLALAFAGECALHLGRWSDAIKILGRVEPAAAIDRVAVALGLAEAYARNGDRTRAIDVLRRVYVEAPEHPNMSLVEARASALLGSPLRLSAGETIERAEHLSDARLHEQAISELDQLGQPADRTELAAWLSVRGTAFFRMRGHYGEAARLLVRAATLGEKSAPDDAFLAGRAWIRDKNVGEAVSVLEAFRKKYPAHPKAREAEFLIATTWLGGNPAAARKRLERLASASSGGDVGREATWLLAFDDFEHGRLAPAERGFEKYAARSADVMVRLRGMYWLARAKEKHRDRAAAVVGYRKVLATEPLHWYALLARQRLVGLDEDPGSAVPNASGAAPSSVGAPPIVLGPLTSFLLAAGSPEEARAVVRQAERSIRSSASRGEGARAMIRALVAVGDVPRASQLATFDDALRTTPTPATRWLWEAAYPRPFFADVDRAARARDLLPEHLYAIMRQESGFDPEAVSYADAVGLLQLLPSTAARVAETLGRRMERNDLFDPPQNIELGATYFGRLVHDFDHVLPLAIAAYNAGEHNVTDWLHARSGMELDRFVEHIPADQTRNYVRRVTTHLAHYLYLRDPAHGWPDIELPARVK